MTILPWAFSRALSSEPDLARPMLASFNRSCGCTHFNFLIFKIVLFCAFLHVTCKSQCYPALCHKNMKLIRHLFTHYL